MKNLVFIFLVGILFTGCSSLQVTADKDSSADFKQYKTFSFMGWNDKTNEGVDEAEKRLIEKAFKQEFEKRGLTYQQKNADISVSLFVLINQETSRTAYTDYYGMGGFGYGYYRHPGWGWGWGMGHAYTTIQEYDYKSKIFVCDVFDEKSKEQVWQGVAKENMDEISNKIERQKRVNYVVKGIMSKYPRR
ncbi:DUF4136 domain-containing protein [Labilibacter sediminis]|nr:DUF4136 domain-containing protein [Labilibacter sediminis]